MVMMPPCEKPVTIGFPTIGIVSRMYRSISAT